MYIACRVKGLELVSDQSMNTYRNVVCLLELYVLTTSTVSTCDYAH